MVKGVTAALACLAMLLMPALAHADRAFSSRFSANTQGDIGFAANGVLTCVQAEPGCVQARDGAGTKLNNNDRVMTYIDVDTDPSTFNSSEAQLSLPSGARVLFAGLYWGGRTSAGTGGLAAPSPGARGTVLFEAPGQTAYTPLTASQVDESGSQQYQGFVDVTSIVAAAGAGAYRAANVQVGTGRNASQAHGWALIVAYGDPAAPTRNLSVFDGFQNVGSGSPGVTIPLSGFQTPLAGAVNSTVGIVAQEGDLATTGDGASITTTRAPAGPRPLSNAANPPSPANLFNSTISRAGVLATDLVPPDTNNFGFDVDSFATANVLGNGQTSTEVRLTTSGDAYNPGVVYIATDLYAPRIQATKTVDQAEAELSEELAYTARFENTGADGAANFTVTDLIPEGTTYVPGSLAIDGVPQTDAADGDSAEFAGDRVLARLGTLAIGEVNQVTFRVTIDSAGFEPGAVIENTASADFVAATTGQNFDPVESAPAQTRLLLPDLTILKTHDPEYVAGGTSTILIGVFNLDGEGPTTGETVVTDTLPAGLTVNGPITGPGTCEVVGQTITCRRSDPLEPVDIEDPQPIIVIPVAIAPGTPTGSLSNTATVANASDPNTANNSVTDEGAVSEPQFDLSIEKEVTSTPPAGLSGYPPGLPITYRITVRNAGPFPATDVQLSDVVPPAFDVVSATPSQGSCIGAACNLGELASDQTVTVDLVLTLSSDASRYPSAETLVNTAEVMTATGVDIDPSNNTAEASIDSLPIVALSITKEFAPERPAAGGPVTYTMEIRNDGPGVADVSFADGFLNPPDVENIQLSVAGGTGECATEPATFPEDPDQNPFWFCTIPQLEVGGTRTVTVTGTLAPNTAGRTVANRAAVSGSSVEQDFSDNLAEVSFVVSSLDVAIEKTLLGPNVVPPGQQAVFRLRAFNAGNLPAPDVVVGDTLPTGFTPAAAPPGCTLVAQQLTCTIGELPVGEERIFEVTGSVEDSAAGQVLRNVATVDTSGPDVSRADNQGEALLFVPPQPELGITKTRVGPASVPVGGEARFALLVTNTGDAPGIDVVVRDTLPVGLTPFSPPAGCAIQGQDVECSVGELPPGEERSFEIQGRAEPSAGGQTLTNRATVLAAEPDPNSANDQSEAQVSVSVPPPPPTPRATPQQPALDVAVDVRAPASPYTVGEPDTWRVVVVNNGPSAASAVELDLARRGARVDDTAVQSAQAGACRVGGAGCALGSLAVGERRRFEVTLRPLEAERLTLAAEVAAAETDTAPPNNKDEESIEPRLAVVSLDVDVTDRRLDPGEPTSVFTTIKTRKRRPARAVQACVRLPQGLAIASRGGAQLRDGRACWRIRRIAGGRARRLRLKLRATGVDQPRRVTLIAKVSGPYVRDRRARVSVLVLPAQEPRGGVTG